MIPDGLNIRQEKDVVYLENKYGFLNVNEAREISELVKDTLITATPKIMIFDNRMLTGAYTPEVDKVWIELYKELPNYVQKSATICHNVVEKLETNYILTQEGIFESFRAFVDTDKEEIMKFLDRYDLTL